MDTKMERFQDLLDNPAVLQFSRRVLTESYVDCAGDYAGEMRDLMDTAFARLLASRHSDAQFAAATASLVDEVFRKQDPGFWFNRLYRHYKRHFKPAHRFGKLKEWLAGDSVLDLGCGNGLTSLVLSQNGYRVYLTDVLDYRDEAARALPFAPMAGTTGIPYPDRAADTAIVFAVLHHVAAADLPGLLSELRRVSRRVIVEEDSYAIPEDLDGLAEALAHDATLREFVALPAGDQVRYLMFVDYFANAVTQGLPQMNMPFEFKTVREWQAYFTAHGFDVQRTLVAGFQPGHFNRSCHIWFVLDRRDAV